MQKTISITFDISDTGKIKDYKLFLSSKDTALTSLGLAVIIDQLNAQHNTSRIKLIYKTILLVIKLRKNSRFAQVKNIPQHHKMKKKVRQTMNKERRQDNIFKQYFNNK